MSPFRLAVRWAISWAECLGQRYGWHTVFMLVGLPGLLLAIPLFYYGRLPEALMKQAH